MSAWLIALCGLIYLAVGIDQGLKGAWPMCITYTAYALANVGLYQLAK